MFRVGWVFIHKFRTKGNGDPRARFSFLEENCYAVFNPVFCEEVGNALDSLSGVADFVDHEDRWYNMVYDFLAGNNEGTTFGTGIPVNRNTPYREDA